ncbi:hypothetical protein CLOACE_17060 [Clostridium acetireducens DSM 10703]|uniref:Uncharacterized protein n=1 Tax=Clostridium acetireducens DSM 10703 TaxID=1121290 RepID=A0A1E8EY55_9CLOT|nr:hypothetical protein [Clostridium acetireducens]OFI05477.1 hypothetical protein CLOACE_17060 [Clostridium acetireducens DSM 10703]
MKAWLVLLAEVFGFAIITLILYNLLKIFVLSKVKVKYWTKWVVLAIAALVFVFPPIMGHNLVGTKWQYVQSGIFVLLFLWFMDLMGWTGGQRVDKNKEVVIRPKAKPNRVKNKEKKK